MKDLILTLLCMLVLLVAGCAHNASFVASGKVFKIGTEAAGLLYVNGLVAVNGTRENSESVVEAGDDDGASGAPTVDAKSIRTVRFRTGPQITGYLVDLAQCDTEAAKLYVKNMHKMNTSAWDTKETLKNASGNASTKSSSEKSSTNNYIDYLKEKLKSLVGKDDKDKGVKETIKGDGEYKELYKDNSIAAQAQLTTELLKYADTTTEMPSSGETIQSALIHYAGRLAQLKAKGKDKATKIILDRATVKDKKLTYLMFRLRNDKDGTYQDEECPSCFDLED